MSSAAFPFPVPDFDAEPYWEACNREQLAMQRCDACQHIRWMPDPLCPACQSTAATWLTLSGRGRVTTWTVVTHPVHPAAVDRVPYVVAEIELEEQAGLRMISNLIEIDPDAVEFDLPVEVTFIAHPEGQKLPMFRVRA
ncbi:MAG: hypothetical protein HKP27_11490 [Myxococcales bacterium]|nr:hypothetical protein [Myxococcales bacterium]